MPAGKIGYEQDLFLTDSMDTWNPYVGGNFARVYEGFIRPNGFFKRGAVKFMRPDRLDSAPPLFRAEVEILQTMRGRLTAINGIDPVVPMWECGFLLPENIQVIPEKGKDGSLHELHGLVQRFPDGTKDFLEKFDQHIQAGWLPYLLIEPVPKEQNLLMQCDRKYRPTQDKYFPLEQALHLLAQACVLLDEAHKRNIVYLDHKIVHYYWDVKLHILRLLDWNAAQLHPAGLTEDLRKFDLVQFVVRTGYHLLTGRDHPDAMQSYSTPEMIAAAKEKTYEANWQYDDTHDDRIPPELRGVIEEALQGKYTSAEALGITFSNLLDKLY